MSDPTIAALALTELPHTVRPDSLLQATLPVNARLEHAFGDKFTALPGPTRMCLLVAALNDRGTIAETLAAAAAALGVPVGADALAPAAEARLIDLDGGLTFRHPLIRSAIVQTTPAPERQAAHAIAPSRK